MEASCRFPFGEATMIEAVRRIGLWCSAELLALAACGNPTKATTGSQQASTTPAATAASSPTTEAPFASPDKEFNATDTTISVLRGIRFDLQLPQDRSAGSWGFSQAAGPVRLESSGSTDGTDGTRLQNFTFKAVATGRVDLTYSNATPPGVTSPITFHITVA